MTRRQFLASVAAVNGLGVGTAAAMVDDPAAWLGATPYVDRDHPSIRAVVATHAPGSMSDRGKALALFRFVRDKIPFGFASGFWDQRASDVLRAGRGYCNTKSTLYVALLRAAGIPSRQVFVDIDAAVLRGLLEPGTPYVDHSYAEVWLDGTWRATDAYIVDQPMFQSAQARLSRDGRVLGYGVHATGACDWDGITPSFAQFNTVDPRPIGARRFGVHADVGAFYRDADRPWNKLNPFLRAGFGLLAGPANAAAERLRSDRGFQSNG